LDDGGAAIFAETIRRTRLLSPGCTIEVLIPDFEGNDTALATVCLEMPEILNHNIETVRRLFPTIRPQGKYQRSIELLGKAKPCIFRARKRSDGLRAMLAPIGVSIAGGIPIDLWSMRPWGSLGTRPLMHSNPNSRQGRRVHGSEPASARMGPCAA
jgi:hypothetical protein